MTRTRKVRRGVIAQRYAEIIDALYAGVDDVTIRSIITYQDGTRVERPITLRIQSMDGFVPAPDRRGKRELAWST
jgi:long-chain acyl-CoA synthetase